MEKRSYLDLRFKGDLDPESSLLFNTISNNLEIDFDELITNLTEPNLNNIDWWVGDIASRNTFATPFFHYYCSIHFIKQLLDNKNFNFNRVLVDSLSLKRIINNILTDNDLKKCEVVLFNNFKFRLKRLFNKYLGDIYIFLYNIIKVFIGKLFYKSNFFDDNQPVTLIDTFIIKGYTDSTRWYGSLWINIPKKIKESTYFIPSINKTTLFNLFGIYSRLKKNNENYILKESHLMITDLLFALRYKRRLDKIKINKNFLFNNDITYLIKESLYNYKDIYSIHESLLTYRFIYRLKKRNSNIRLAIDWFEGQNIDKAWNLALHTFYPKTKTIAYRPFESFPLYLCSFPTYTEKRAKVIPKVFALQGAGSINNIKRYLPDLNTILIPSYKSEFVWTLNEEEKISDNRNILVTLPISFDISLYIFSLIEYFCIHNLDNNDIKFIIKPHPAHNTNIKSSFKSKSLPYNILVTEESSFPNLLKETSILITEASTTCLEAISVGIPTILIKRKNGLFYNPIPESIDKDLFEICSDANDLNNAITKYLNITELNKQEFIIKSHKVREEFFQPITNEGTNKFMDLNQKEIELNE